MHGRTNTVRVSSLVAFAMLCGMLVRASSMTTSATEGEPFTDVSESYASYGDARRFEFSLARIKYDSTGGMNEAYYNYEGRTWERWETDHPQADTNFMFRLSELTTLYANPASVVVLLTDPELFAHPFIYMCDVGWMDLSAAETANLREYLLRGGFLWVDDFWGAGEWENFERVMRDVLPEQAWRELPNDHIILSTVFPLERTPQVPARDFAIANWIHDPPSFHRQPADGIEDVHLRAYFDDDERMVVVATFNTDIGDGWEREGYGEWYFEKYSTVAYAMGANVVAYGLTH